MNKTQKTYALALALYEQATKAVNAELETIEHIEDIDEWAAASEQISDRYGTAKLYDALWDAEEAMITWAYKRVKRSKHCVGAMAEANEFCYQNRTSPIARRRLIDAAFRYSGK